MNKKRIVIIRNANSYDFGGGERFPVFLAVELKKLNFEPMVVSRSQKLLAFADKNEIDTDRGWWWQRQNWSGKHALLFPIYFVWQIIMTVWYIRLFVLRKPDIVHIQSKDDFISATLASKLLRKRIIWTDHADLKHIWKNMNIWYKNPVGKLVYFASRYADAITVVSEGEFMLVTNNLSKNSPIRAKLHIIHNGVIDTSSNYKKTGPKTQFIFCTVSRLVTDKGIGEMIDAFLKLSKDFRNIKLNIIGDGPEEEKFKKVAKGHNNIEFFGYQSDPLGYIRNCDVYLTATYHEGFSLSLVEASMLGCPIIATSASGNVEIIHNHQTGLLVPVKNVSALYDAMKLLYADGKLRQTLAKNARAQYEKNFQFDQIVKDKFIPLYEGIDK